MVFAFHGYQRAVHAIVHGRPNAGTLPRARFIEQGTTTTPFDMVVLNEMSRYHLVMSALHRARRSDLPVEALVAQCRSAIESATAYAHTHFEDPADIRNWQWTD